MSRHNITSYKLKVGCEPKTPKRKATWNGKVLEPRSPGRRFKSPGKV